MLPSRSTTAFDGLVEIVLSVHVTPKWEMTNVSTFEGLLSCVLIFICSCAHLRRVKALKPLINNAVKQFGPLSIFHKASVIGLRLQVPIGILCITVAIYVIVRWQVSNTSGASKFWDLEFLVAPAWMALIGFTNHQRQLREEISRGGRENIQTSLPGPWVLEIAGSWSIHRWRLIESLLGTIKTVAISGMHFCSTIRVQNSVLPYWTSSAITEGFKHSLPFLATFDDALRTHLENSVFLRPMSACSTPIHLRWQRSCNHRFNVIYLSTRKMDSRIPLITSIFGCPWQYQHVSDLRP